MRGRLYRLYGCLIQSHLPLYAPVAQNKKNKVQIRILKTPPGISFSRLKPGLSRNKIRYISLSDGTVEIHFFHSHQCRISPDGKTVYFKNLLAPKSRAFPNANRVFAHFVRNNVLSFCLLKSGIESLHGSAVVIKKKVVGFIGQSAYGKSSLAAAFLQLNYPVFSDDLLAIRKIRDKFHAAPGVAHLKLYHETARAFLPQTIKGIPMNPVAEKKIYPLPARYSGKDLLPLGALYVLHPRYLKRTSPRIRIRPFSHREAVINLIRSTHNLVLQDPARIQTQFIFASALASQIPVRAVSYPRDFSRIPELRNVLLRDITRQLAVFHKLQKGKHQSRKNLFC